MLELPCGNAYDRTVNKDASLSLLVDLREQAAGRLLGSAFLVMTFSVMSKILGFARESSIAAAFGASATSDAYFVALTVPGLVFGLVGQILSTTGVPVFSQYLGAQKPTAYTLIWTSFYATVALTFLLVVVGLVGATPLTGLIAPGLSPETKAIAVHLTRVMMPAVLFMGLSGWATAVLHSHYQFAAPAAVGVVYNVGVILSTWFAWSQGQVVWLALGTVLAYALQFGIQIVPLLRRVGSVRWVFQLSHPGLLRMLQLAPPVVAGAGVAQLNFVVDRVLASGLSEGAISVLNYAQRVAQLPIGLVATPVVTVLFPALSSRAHDVDQQHLRPLIVNGLNALTFTMLPLSAGLILMAEDVVRILFERGAFGPTDTVRTAGVLRWYAAGIVFFAWREHLNRTYYALQDTRTPVVAGIVSVVINIVLNLLLIDRYGAPALALSTLVATLAHCLWLLWPLHRLVVPILGPDLWLGTAKMAIAAALMIAGVLGAQQLLATTGVHQAVVLGSPLSLEGIAASGIRLMVLAVVGALLYVISAWTLRIHELFLLARWMAGMVQRVRWQGRRR